MRFSVLVNCLMIFISAHVGLFSLLMYLKNEPCSAFQQKPETNVTGSSFLMKIIKLKLNFSYDGFGFSDYYLPAANDHYQTTLGNLNNQLVAIGSASKRNNIVETFDFESNTWAMQSEFSYCSME